MNDREFKGLLLGLLPDLRLNASQRDRLWSRISTGLDPPTERLKQPTAEIRVIKNREVLNDGRA